MKPNSRLKALSAAVGGVALAAMGALAVAMGMADGPGAAAEVATINAPEAPEMTLGETITAATTTTSILSFRPSVTASPPPPASPGD